MIALDANFTPLAVIDNFESFIWHEKYFTVGSFEMHIGYKIDNFVYVYNKDFKEAGVVEEINITDNKFIYKGRFLKSLLDNKVIHKTMIYENKTVEFIAKDLVREFAGQEILVEPIVNLGTAISIQVTGDNLLEFIDKLLETQELGCYIDYDYVNNTKTFRVFKGLDSTLTKPPLSQNYENIFSFNYFLNKQNVKNFAYVAGEATGSKTRKIIEVDIRKNPEEEKRELWVDARDLQSEKYNEDGSSETIPEAQYLEMLKQRGLEKLSEYQIEETIEIQPNDTFEIGEKRVFKAQNLMTEQRVTEIITAFEENAIKKDAVFGLQKLSRVEEIKREVQK